MENTELKKHLVSVIDEAIAEIEELKKSKFQAQEIKLEGPGKGIDGKPADGSLGKEEDSDKDEDDKDEKEVEKAEDDKSEEEVDKADDEKDEDEDEKKKKDAKKDDKKDEKKEEVPFAKSLEAQEQLLKSYVDEKFSSLESKIASVLDSVRTLADQPVGPKGVTVDKFAALEKSAPEVVVAPLNKSAIADQLFELKKSKAQHVDSADIYKVETGNQNDIQTVAKKYGLVK